MVSLDQIMHNIVIIWLPLTMVLLSSLLFLKTKMKFRRQNNKKVIIHPPNPPKLPLLGHLHLITSLPHRSFCNLSKKYGPVMFLKLGSVPTVVISSADAAKEVLKVHDLACCSRPQSAAGARFSYNYLDIGLAPYGEYWREVRKICVLKLFNVRRVQSFQMIREEEIGVLLNSISQSSSSATPIDLSEKFYSLTANMITRIAFGKSFRGGELDNENFQKVIRRAVAALGSFSATDFFPRVGWIIDRISGVHKRLEMSFAELDAFLQHVVDDRTKFRESSSHNDDYQENIVDVLLKMEKDGSEFDVVKLTRDCIKALVMDIFLGGVETGANTLVWAMTELIKNPKVMKKLQDEIRSCIRENVVKESDLDKLEYLKAVVKEVLRLHTPVPLLLPRETMSHFKLNGYDIHPKTHIHVNVWAIGRDPESWTNPEAFLPERFIGSNIDYKGQNFELLPFGTGRRICPGMSMATITVELALANILLCFDWKLPNGMKEKDVDMEEESGIAVAKKSPLQLLPIPYLNSKE
ncbi:cytochrome P450 71B37-like [Benincasa hispida]|uniref:cytochrome P450 71B37-like n=1 Tax=Benincasa hispida TaxID=102211 RepID=UPI00190172E7|nr:cytochrome P450 71B37-like [Benincasa hispida]